MGCYLVGVPVIVAVLSNAIHLAADTGRVITCPFVPGQLPDDAIAMIVVVEQPEGTLLPELVQWLPSAALDEPIGSIGAAARPQRSWPHSSRSRPPRRGAQSPDVSSPSG